MKERWFAFFMFLVAFLLQIMPLPGFVIWLRPSFVLLVILFWMMRAPGVFGLTTVFFIGLLLDLFTGTLLGEHAFGFVLLAYLALKWQRQWMTMPLPQQTISIVILVMVNKLCLTFIQGFSGLWPHSILFWMAVFLDAAFWIWMWLFFGEMLRHMRT